MDSATTFGIDRDCTIRNFPQSNPLDLTLINFNFPQHASYLIVFDNVYYIGNMSCNDPTQSDFWIWWVNGSFNTISARCREFLLPVDAINKQNPAGTTTAAIGVPFTYTLTFPEMVILTSTGYVGSGEPDPEDVQFVTITDDLNATGAALTYVSNNAYRINPDSSITQLGALNVTTSDNKLLVFSHTNNPALALIPAGSKLVIELTVVLDDSPVNVPGTQFINTATWEFGKYVDLDEDGQLDEDEWFDPLTGQSGVSPPLTIAGPELVVTKTGSETAVNMGVDVTFTIDVQNNGGASAWNATIVDLLPDVPGVTGMCPATEPTVSAQIFAADGVTPVSPPLVLNSDFTLTYSGAPTCQLSLTMTSANAVIGPTQRLIITYTTQLDPDTNTDPGVADGIDLTNIAGATQWFSANPSGGYPYSTYTRTITDGTPGVVDHQDSFTVTTALSGYYFQKTVQNLTSGANPATTAVSGDRLRYRVRIFNFDEIINDVTVSDVLDPTLFDLSTFTMVTPPPAGATYTFNNVTGLLEISGNPPPLNLVPPSELVVEFEINVAQGLVNGTEVPNQASFTAVGPPAITAYSDDPNVNGIAGPGEPADPTTVVIYAPGALAKANTQASATIGEQFTYTITVPATAIDAPLYDVRILDDLSASAADLRFVSATVQQGGNWTLSNTGTDTNLVIEDTATGIDIPAGQQAVILITVELLNTLDNNNGLTFTNSASYTYNRANGNAATQAIGSGGSTGTMTVVEPVLTLTKTVSNVSVGKQPTDPATVGDVLEYVVTVPNSGTSTAFDTSVVDTLPVNVSLVPDSATAQINGVPVAGFVANPDPLPGNAFAWGRANDDGSLDIPVGGVLVLTYRVTVDSVNGVPLNNSVYVDWTSLQNPQSGERNGFGCPTGIVAPNDYCYGPITAPFATADLTTLVKTVVADTWNSGGSTDTDSILRVGDTVDYRLMLTLREGQLQNVVVTDTLPAGLAFDSVLSIHGDATAPYSATAPFTYTDIPASNVPAAGQTGTLTWTLGDITNAVDNNTANDTLEIVYRARVVEDVLAHAPTTPLQNTAALTYVGSGTSVADPAQLVSSAPITVQQPLITTISKVDTAGGRTGSGTLADPYQMNIATDVMNFQLQACNTGLAPAYGVVITDQLAPELNEASITTPAVTINGNPATAGVDYSYTPPGARGGTLGFTLITPIEPAQCVTVAYNVGFYTDVGPNQVWNNSATVERYWSLPPANAQEYGVTISPVTPAAVYMTNAVNIFPPLKVMTSPASGEATIGEQVVYEITVPGTATNAALYNVVVTDTLHPSLAYVSATATLGGNPLALTDNTTGNNVSLTIAQIPAGQQAVILLTARVANNAEANAGVSFTNTASYTYAANSGDPSTLPGGNATTPSPLTLVEPLLAINKGVTNLTNPGIPPTAGDVLHYTLTFPASTGPEYSGAFDLSIVDSLSLGLGYQSGTATVNGAGNTIADPVITGDGVVTPQTLTWSLATATADIDVPEGATVTVTYDVRVLDSALPNQDLVNSATVRWTGLDGASADERTGADCPSAPNDYCAGPVTATLTTPDSTSLAKARLTDTYGAGDVNVRVGDLIDYELRIVLQEGQHQNLVLSDTLPQGLAFEGTVSINGDTTAPYNAVAPFAHADISAASVSGDPVTGPTTVTWTLGNVVNVADGNVANDEFVVVYRARVVNEVHPHVNSITLTNNARLDYTTGTGAALRTATIDITVLQPLLAVSKAAAPANGDTILDAGELVTYTVDILNSGTAPAYDVVLQDIIPVGLRNGAATITVVSTSLLSGPALPNLAPVYDAGTGFATWNFDTGAANVYTIPPGDTLRLVYQVQADANLGAGLTLTNQAQVQLYYSFDDEAVPSLGGVNGVREIYGPTNTATTTLTTPTPGALLKQNPAVTTVAIGQPFTYRVTVPATPVATALHDVRILDDLSASAASLSFVSVTKVSGSQPWTPVNTGTATNLVIEDPVIGIDIPAGEQVVIDITVVLNDSPSNVTGLQFSNTASYTYNQINDTPSPQPGAGDTTGNLTIVGPDALTLEKSGPTEMRPGVPGTFTVNVHNTGTGTAWGVTVTDLLPNPTPGGMCDAAPTNVTARLYLADGVTPAGGPLVAGSDFAVNFTGAPSCTFTIVMQSAAGAIPADHRLIITYQALLDVDNVNGTSLTNVAGATQWYSANPAGGGTPHTYTGALTDGTVGILDNQDAHTVAIETPVLVFQKTVENVTSGNATAEPGDVLRYTLRIENISPVPVNNSSLVDELDRLNTPPLFQAGSLTVTTAPGGSDTSNTNPTGGTQGTGLVDIRNFTLAASDGAPGGPDELLVVYEVRLVSSIANGTLVRNQAQLVNAGPAPINSDDPNVNGADDPNVLGDEDPTQIAVASAPAFQVLKTSQDITGDPATLMPGETLRYTITVKNVGNEDAANVGLQDAIPANTTYVANSTTLNGVAVPDVGGNSPLQAGMLIHSPANPTPGVMPANPDPAANNVATIVFDVVINADATDGTEISNQGFVNGAGAGGIVFPTLPSDGNQATPEAEPTVDIVSRPNGIIYDSVRRVPIAGATVSLQRVLAGSTAPVPVPSECFSDPAQQNQVTPAGGYYKFDLNFSHPDCPPGGDYIIAVTAVPDGYNVVDGPSRILTPTTRATTGAYSVPACPADAVPSTTDRCEAQASGAVPTGVAATTYYLHLTLSNGEVPRDSQIFNNHIPIDPELEAAIAITKTSPLINVTRGQLVPYTITVKNTLGGSIQDLVIVDTLPPGFKYVEGSSRFDGNPLEPVSVGNGRQLRWENLELVYNQSHNIKMLLVVSSGVSEGEYVNRAQVRNVVLDQDVSGVATATVRVVPDPTFDCTDIIGKVYDDANLNGYQDQNEKGISGVRVVSARGLLARTDEHGRFHITCAAVPNQDRGSNFILKVDDRTLPAGYRMTTENPVVERVTRGKTAKFNFGAALHRVVRLDIADGVFEPNSTEVRPQWTPRFGMLLDELRKSPAILRISYLADVEEPGTVKARLEAIKREMSGRWAELNCCYQLQIETEIFWRRGGPPDRNAVGR